MPNAPRLKSQILICFAPRSINGSAFQTFGIGPALPLTLKKSLGSSGAACLRGAVQSAGGVKFIGARGCDYGRSNHCSIGAVLLLILCQRMCFVMTSRLSNNDSISSRS